MNRSLLKIKMHAPNYESDKLMQHDKTDDKVNAIRPNTWKTDILAMFFPL